MNLHEAVDYREKGEVPVSIGTALALAGLIGKHPDRPEVKPPPIDSVELLMVNVRTLFRNLLGAVDRKSKELLTSLHLTPALFEELSIISAFVSEYTNSRTQTLFYVGGYEQLSTPEFRGALIKTPTTPGQMFYNQLEQKTIDLLKDKQLPDNVVEFKGAIQGKFPKTAILTHFPIDLLYKNQFQKLELLESHTGALKSPGMWGSKLTGQNTQILPLNVFTLKVFGDGVMFNGHRPTVKRALMEVAMVDRWSGLSTMALIDNSIKKVADPQVRSELQSLL